MPPVEAPPVLGSPPVPPMPAPPTESPPVSAPPVPGSWPPEDVVVCPAVPASWFTSRTYLPSMPRTEVQPTATTTAKAAAGPLSIETAYDRSQPRSTSPQKDLWIALRSWRRRRAPAQDAVRGVESE